jgi:hypothetical protein
MDIHELPIDQLEAHPHNANVMGEALLKKLTRHIEQSDQYPPVIVRSMHQADDPTPRYQMLDGHHRVIALKRLGRTQARCVIWQVDDEQALTLLATLNRLEGRDDPKRRAALLAALNEHRSLASLSEHLPEPAYQLKRMMQANHGPPAPATPTPSEQMPETVHFFLYPAQRQAVETRLRAIGGSREQALLSALGLEGDPA